MLRLAYTVIVIIVFARGHTRFPPELERTLHIKYVFLGTPLARPDFVSILPLRFIPAGTLGKYDLHSYYTSTG